MGLVSGNLTAVAQFPPIGTSEQSDECYRLIKEGVVTATSIGFIPKKWEFLDREFGGGIRFLEVECQARRGAFDRRHLKRAFLAGVLHAFFNKNTMAVGVTSP